MEPHKNRSAFLTGINIGDERGEELPEEEDECVGVLVPFRVPPMAHRVVSHRYVSLNYSTSSSSTVSRTLLNWEKQMILSRLQKSPCVDKEAFQERLSRMNIRNDRQYIRQVCDRVEEVNQAEAKARQAAFLRAEERRDFIFYKHQHLVEIKRREQTLTRARKWSIIVVCHVFLAALMQERRVQEALDTFSFLLAPMIRRFLALRARRREAEELTRRHLRDIPFPFPQVIQSMTGTFFEGWPPVLLEKLVEKSKPCYLRKGRYLMHEGDVGRVMFMITLGTVSIVLRKKGGDKRRTKENSSGVLQITAPCYAGEFALVCKEPRSASIICETDIGYWAVSPEDYEEVAKYLSPTVASKQREATDVRRRQNLKRFFPLHVAFLRNFPYFAQFSDKSLTQLIDSVEPIVLHDGDYLFREGELDSSTYFVQDGEAVLRDREGADRKVLKGSCIGVFECSCGVNESKRHSIVSVDYCDIWRLSRDVLIERGMSEPAALLHCRDAAKKDRALEMHKDKGALQCFRKDPYMSFCCPRSTLTQLFEASTPTVFLNGERIALMGKTLNVLSVVMSGVLDITMSRNEQHITMRVHVTASVVSDAAFRNASAPFRGLSRVIGAYEFASSLSQYACTVTSVGLTEAFVIERAQLEMKVPAALRGLMHDSVRSRECVSRAYKQENAGLLYNDETLSFSRLYRELRTLEGETRK
ncbi:cyclic nucleotide-binding protein-like protein [Leishmania mexicana MHOM/GT/2001/U1103]|uniref:Cyclic nucleotide-binding protein-like protein n=1 Tax=Leishmania mexicana (strain MHOM/GT/2001/U1103) TaxID=929439 RepID=E9B3H5_LEIMU|nr:cyclic nucleotide-binding protein-like protein [Leishmania mexicana MHOM/GT/2001/U1103]CBZ29792.1 cyclic nucleotide-binding protein-like protein [Leishmania mexicana MHOM/GT/2001/U1103]